MQTRVSRDMHRCAASLELEGQISLTTLTEANVAFGVCGCYGIFSLTCLQPPSCTFRKPLGEGNLYLP